MGDDIKYNHKAAKSSPKLLVTARAVLQTPHQDKDQKMVNEARGAAVLG